MKPQQLLRRSILLLVFTAVCLMPATVPAWAADDEPPPLDLSEETTERMMALAGMFGADNLVNHGMAALLLSYPDSGVGNSLEASLDDIERAIELSGIETDFAAPPEPTGDELFDRYARAVDDRLNTIETADMDGLLAVAILPDEMLAAWEPEFGEDPRYWELRYLLADARDSGLCTNEPGAAAEETAPDARSDDTAVPRPRPVDFLLEAERRGCASANTLLLLYSEVCYEHEQAFDELTAYDGAVNITGWSAGRVRLPLRPEFSAEVLDGARKLHAAAEKREEEILEAACFRGHGEAWPRYFRGMHRLSMGDFDAGLRDMKQGNAAPVNRYPVPFPVAEIEDSILAGKPIGGPVVCGAVELVLVSYLIPNYIKIKDHCRAAIAAAELGGEIEAYDAWHHFACRLAESREGLLLNSLVSTVLVRILRAGFMENHADELDAGRLEALWRFNTATDATKARAILRSGAYDETSAALTLGFAGGARGIALNQYLYAAMDLHFVHEYMLPVTQDMAEFSYLDLRTPAAMEKYEPVPDDVYKSWTRCRRAARAANKHFREAHASFDLILSMVIAGIQNND